MVKSKKTKRKRILSLILGLVLLSSAAVAIVVRTPSLYTGNPSRQVFIILWDSNLKRAASGWLAIGIFNSTGGLEEAVTLRNDYAVAFTHNNYTVGKSFTFIGYYLTSEGRTATFNFGSIAIESYDTKYFIVRLILPTSFHPA